MVLQWFCSLWTGFNRKRLFDMGPLFPGWRGRVFVRAPYPSSLFCSFSFFSFCQLVVFVVFPCAEHIHMSVPVFVVSLSLSRSLSVFEIEQVQSSANHCNYIKHAHVSGPPILRHPHLIGLESKPKKEKDLGIKLPIANKELSLSIACRCQSGQSTQDGSLDGSVQMALPQPAPQTLSFSKQDLLGVVGDLTCCQVSTDATSRLSGRVAKGLTQKRRNSKGLEQAQPISCMLCESECFLDT